MSDELDFSNFDGIDELDWSDVEDELKKNREMIITEGGQEASASMGGGNPLIGGGSVDVGTPAPISTANAVEINFLLDIPLTLKVEIGRTKMLIKELLGLDLDSILELNKKIGEPMDVYINKKLVARGEVVVQNEKFGLKITEIIDEAERLKKLQSI